MCRKMLALLCCGLFFLFSLPIPANGHWPEPLSETIYFLPLADGTTPRHKNKTIRIAYFSLPGFFSVHNGVASGYVPDALSLIARYTGWKYEYVEASVEDLPRLLREGRADLACGLTYTAERSKIYRFSKIPVGYMHTALHVPMDSPISYADYASFNGMRIGFFNHSQAIDRMRAYGMYRNFTFSPRIFQSQEAMRQALENGEIDGYVNGIINSSGTKVAVNVAMDAFFFISSKEDREIIPSVDEAMRNILLNHPEFLAKQAENFLNRTPGSTILFNRKEREYLKTSPVLRVAYSAKQEMMVPDLGSNFMLELFSLLEKKSGIRFEKIAFPSYRDALLAVKEGKADIVTDISPLTTLPDQFGITPTRVYYNSPILLRIHKDSPPQIGKGCTIGATEEQIAFIPQYTKSYPNDTVTTYQTWEDCYAAFKRGEIDACLWPYPSALPSEELEQGETIVTSQAYYSISLGVSNQTPPDALSTLNTVISGTAGADIDALRFRSAPRNFWDAVLTYRWEISTGFVLLLFMLSLLFFRESHRRDEAIKKSLSIDPVTGGPNRGKFQKEAEKFLSTMEKNSYLSCININRLKQFNQIYGGASGDDLLRFIYKELRTHITSEELCAYTGSGHFLLLLCDGDNTTHSQRINDLLKKIDKTATEHFQYAVRFSCGSTAIDGELLKKQLRQEKLCNISRFIFQAESAESTAKNQLTGPQFRLYDESIGKGEMKVSELESQMRTALESGEFTVYMQPQINLKTKALHGAEALIRWRKEDGRIIPPDEFIPIFEQNGFIRDIDLYVLDMVCGWIRQRLEAGKKCPPISVNQSKVLLYREDYVKTLLEIIRRHHVPLRLLHMEVTESMAYLDEHTFQNTLSRLRQNDISVHLDDFGKGYSSLSMLQSLHFDTIKLDKEFLRGTGRRESKTWPIISSISGLANALGVGILCEGVETHEQVLRLVDAGCLYGQGYFFAKPMPLKDFETFVDKSVLEDEDSPSA